MKSLKSWLAKLVSCTLLAASACTSERLIDGLDPKIRQPYYSFVAPLKTSIPGASRFDIYFTQPGTNATDGIDPVVDDDLVALMNSATTSIDLAVFDFSRQNIIAAVVAAKNRGVVVRMVGDGDNTSDAGYVQLAAAAVPISNRPAGSAIMHDKFIVVDSRYLVTGSMNMSENDVMLNNNNVLIIENATMVTAYKAEFNEMFAGNRFGSAKNSVMPTNAATVNGINVEYYSGPKQSLMAQVLAKVATANVSIHNMIFTYTRADLTTQLLARKAAGVKLYTVFDQLQAGGQYSQTNSVATAGGASWIDGNNHSNGNGGGILHHKVMIIDGNTPNSDPMVITGSFNWTDAAEQDNDENLVIFHSSAIAQLYLQEYCATVGVARIASAYTGSTDTGCGGKIVINEILANPTGTDSGQEFIEIANAGIGSVNVGGWTLTVGATLRHTFPSNFTIPAGGVTVVFDSGIHSAISGAVNASTGSFSLTNTGGSVTLKDAFGTTVETFTWGNTTEGTSHNRSPDLTQAGAIALHSTISATTNSPGKRADQSTYNGIGSVMNAIPTPVAKNLVITQFATRGLTSASDEFVEIYNNTNQQLDLSGVKIQYLTTSCAAWSDRLTITNGTLLAPGQYYLAVNTAGYAAPTSGLPADANLSTAGFADSGSLRLLSAGAAQLDLVAFGTGLSCSGEGTTTTTNHGTTSNGNSMKRKPGTLKYTNAYPVQDNDNNSGDFVLVSRTVHNGSSVAEPSFGVATPVAGDLVISQFSTRGILSASDEFVEVYNNSRKTLTIDGLKIQYSTSTCASWSDRLVIPTGFTLAPGKFYLAVNSAGYVAPASGPAADGLLSTSGFADSAQLRLLSAAAVSLDLVAFGSGLSCTGEGLTVAPNHGTAANSSAIARRPADTGGTYSPSTPIADVNNNLSDFGLKATRGARNMATPAQPSK